MTAGQHNNAVCDGIMPELYAVSSEDRRRISDSEETVLDHEDISMTDGMRSLSANAGMAVGAYGAEYIPVSRQYALLIAVATDALEMARRIRPG